MRVTLPLSFSNNFRNQCSLWMDSSGFIQLLEKNHALLHKFLKNCLKHPDEIQWYHDHKTLLKQVTSYVTSDSILSLIQNKNHERHLATYLLSEKIKIFLKSNQLLNFLKNFEEMDLVHISDTVEESFNRFVLIIRLLEYVKDEESLLIIKAILVNKLSLDYLPDGLLSLENFETESILSERKESIATLLEEDGEIFDSLLSKNLKKLTSATKIEKLSDELLVAFFRFIRTEDIPATLLTCKKWKLLAEEEILKKRFETYLEKDTCKIVKNERYAISLAKAHSVKGSLSVLRELGTQPQRINPSRFNIDAVLLFAIKHKNFPLFFYTYTFYSHESKRFDELLSLFFLDPEKNLQYIKFCMEKLNSKQFSIEESTEIKKHAKCLTEEILQRIHIQPNQQLNQKIFLETCRVIEKHDLEKQNLIVFDLGIGDKKEYWTKKMQLFIEAGWDPYDMFLVFSAFSPKPKKELLKKWCKFILSKSFASLENALLVAEVLNKHLYNENTTLIENLIIEIICDKCFVSEITSIKMFPDKFIKRSIEALIELKHLDKADLLISIMPTEVEKLERARLEYLEKENDNADGLFSSDDDLLASDPEVDEDEFGESISDASEYSEEETSE